MNASLKSPGALLLALMFFGVSLQAGFTGPEFTYQGELLDGGSPASGSWDFEFELWDSDAGGSSVSSTVSQTLMVNDGIFSTELDFGVDPFDGNELWLEIRARPMGGGGFTTLSPRQKVTAAPYAHAARTLTAKCPPGVALSFVDPNGVAHCYSIPADDWSDVGDGRIESAAGVRIQPDPPADFPFTIRHDSNILSSHVYLTESSLNDYARLNFHNDNTLERFWTIAARVHDSGVEADLINFYNRGANGGIGADILSIRGNRRVGINTINPQSALHVVGTEGVRVENLAHGEANLRPVMANMFGDLVLQTDATRRSYSVNGTAFQPMSSIDSFAQAYSGASIAGSQGWLAAAVNLPDGAMVHNITAWVVDNEPAESLQVYLAYTEHGMPVSVNDNIAFLETTSDSMNFQQLSDSFDPPLVIDNYTRAYHLVATTGNTIWPVYPHALSVNGVRIEYTE